jgi:hypothetical protein
MTGVPGPVPSSQVHNEPQIGRVGHVTYPANEPPSRADDDRQPLPASTKATVQNGCSDLGDTFVVTGIGPGKRCIDVEALLHS